MKRKLVLVLSGAILLASTSPLRADDNGGAIIMDVVVARPACLAATAVGSVFFVLSLPFALASKRVNWAAENLVVTPARATFTRPLGDFHSLRD
jgi:hypothetical protein